MYQNVNFFQMKKGEPHLSITHLTKKILNIRPQERLLKVDYPPRSTRTLLRDVLKRSARKQLWGIEKSLK